MDSLDEDDLDTILTIARNGQSGRITEREIKLLVLAYRRLNFAAPATPQ
jgi:hypothetical protein